ncbi:hypothetical protein BN946_scf184908.g126 [Trametes cinnabarina]|uniref:NADP-dependent oxidoreductase domain-containing protein n=1 Tax=Pycnoporus cinnabarinus TaxID=5643 RepID=A0A060SG44_PYCCI|nr:hypothetical protein BN946_scf184908.g126 [Trametes cinnabarina]
MQAGYRLIDTAWIYAGTEKATALAIKKSGVPREEVWITTKLHHQHGPFTQKFFQESLDNLETNYVDLYLMHWPQTSKWVGESSPLVEDLRVGLLCTIEGVPEPTDEHGDIITTDEWTFTQTWAEMEKLYESGRAKAIGVSNFSVKNLEKLFETAKVVPAVNQVEMHPYLVQQDLKDYCDKKGIVLTAYTPTGYKNVLTDPTITELAEKYKASPAQIVLNWHVARGVAVVPKSSNEHRQKENLTLLDLEPEDVKRITALDRNQRLCNYANERGKVWGWTYEQLGW